MEVGKPMKQINKEKVVNDLEAMWVCCKNRQNIKAYDEIEREMFADWAKTIDDVLALLKEQEAIVKCKNCRYWYRDARLCARCENNS